MTGSKKKLIFIHGMFNNSKAWKHWKTYFTDLGYETHAIDWPYHAGEPSDLRRSPDARLGKVKFNDVLAILRSEINKIGIDSILVGHSMGGLFVQKLISLGVGSAGICISSVAPMGVITFDIRFLKSGLPVINPFAGNKPYVMPLSHFKYTFCNTISDADTSKIYEEFLVPESRNIARSSAGFSSKIDFKKPHAPLLFLSGKSDNFIPESLNKKNAAAYKDQGSLVEFKSFANRGHFICGQSGWEEVAKATENFLDRLK